METLNKNSLKSLEELERYKQSIEVTDGLSLSQVCNITNLETYTIQNWVKRAYIPRPIKKKYYMKHLSRILLIKALKECMLIEDINTLMVYVNGDVDDESDDTLSEEDFYKLLVTLIDEVDQLDNIDQLIDHKVKQEKLRICMKIFVNAYISSQLTLRVKNYLKAIK